MDALGAVGLALSFFAPGFLLHRAVWPDRRFLDDAPFDLFVAVAGSLAVAVLVGTALAAVNAFRADAILVVLAAISAAILSVAALRKRGRMRASQPDDESAAQSIRESLDRLVGTRDGLLANDPRRTEIDAQIAAGRARLGRLLYKR